MKNRRVAGTGPGPYGSPVILSKQMQVLPWAFVRAHAFPKQSLGEFYAAVEDFRQHEIARNAIFMPKEAYMHPYSHPTQGIDALAVAQAKFAAMQRTVLDRHVAGAPISRREALERLALSIPSDPSTRGYQQIRSAAARAAGAPAVNARQLSRYTVNCMPPAVVAKRAALYQPFGPTINPRSIVSRDRTATSVIPNRVQSVLKRTW